jgi:hypothetical protein
MGRWSDFGYLWRSEGSLTQRQPCLQALRGVLAGAVEQEESARKQASCGNSHQDDGVAVGRLGSGWSGGRVVLTLGASLREEGRG